MAAEVGVAVLTALLEDVAVRLRALQVIKRKSKRIALYLDALRAQLPRMARLGGDVSVVEAFVQTLSQIVQRIQNRRDAKGFLVSMMMAKRERSKLDEAFEDLKSAVDAYRLAQGVRMEELLLQDRREQDEDAKDGVDDARALRTVLMETTKADPRLAGKAQDVLDMIGGLTDEEVSSRLEPGFGHDRLYRSFTELGDSANREMDGERANIRGEDLAVDEDHVLGRGGFGEVLQGTWTTPKGNKRRVAVKRVPLNESVMIFQEQEELRKESEKWKTLTHKNIVKLHGTCVQNNRLYLVMEYCDITLGNLLYDQRDVDLTTVRQEMIMKGIASGLAYLHSKSIIHRDVKPSNILLSRDFGKIKLTDFGISTEIGESRALTTSVRGSTAYLPPECLDHPAIWTLRADVYALGITFFELTHRQRPWSEASFMEIRKHVFEQDNRPVLGDELAPWLRELIAQCWERSPARRPTSAEVVTALEKNTRRRRSTRIMTSMFGGFGRMLGRDLPVPSADDDEEEEDEDEGRAIELSEKVIRSLEKLGQPSKRFRAAEKLFKLLSGDSEPAQPISDDSAELRKVRMRALQVGGALELVSALSGESDTDIVRNLIKALFYLGRVLEHQEAIWSHIVEVGGASALVTCMRNSMDDNEIQAYGLGTLTYLGSQLDAQVYLLGPKIQVLDLVIASMRTHKNDPLMIENALALLANLAFESEINQQKLMDADVPLHVILAMQSHSFDSRICMRGAGCLANLAFQPANKVRLMKSDLDTAEVLLESLQVHPNDMNVAESVMMAIRNLLDDSTNRSKFLKLDIARHIAKVLANKDATPSAIEETCGAVWNLAQHNRATKGDLVALGVPEAIKRALRRFPSQTSLQTLGKDTLRCLA